MKNSYPFRPLRNTKRGYGIQSSLVVVFALVSTITLVFTIDRFSSGAISESVRLGASGARSLAASSGAVMRESGFLSSRATLARENEALRREIALHAEEIAQSEFLREENEVLRTIVSLAEQEPGVSARVISAYQSSLYGTFLIDAGTRDGVREGDVVLTPGGFVFGEVTTATSQSASVRTLFASDAHIDLVAQDVAFTASGRGGGNARAEIPRDSSVAVGTPVRAPEYGSRIVGTVQRIETASSSATHTLFIRIPVNLQTLQFVYVAKR